MSKTSRYEYLKEISQRYLKSSEEEKQKILDEFCKVCSYNRKYAIRLLNEFTEKANIKDAPLSKKSDGKIFIKLKK